MVHEEGSILIDRPIEVVFDFIADGMNNPRWRTSVIDIQPVAGKPGTYKQGVKGPGGRTDSDYEVTEMKPNELISIRVIAGPVRPTASFKFEPDGNSTRVTYILHFEPKGYARLMEPMVRTNMHTELGMLPNLKTCLESI